MKLTKLINKTSNNSNITLSSLLNNLFFAIAGILIFFSVNIFCTTTTTNSTQKSAADLAEIDRLCLVENFKNSKFQVTPNQCNTIDTNCCYMSFKYEMSRVQFNNSYCFSLKKRSEQTNTTYAIAALSKNILQELVWFANWTINSFNIYDIIGQNYVDSPVLKNPYCVPPVTRPAKLKYCAQGYGNASNYDTVNDCTPVQEILQWGGSPAINNIATAYYDLYRTPALFIPPCQNLTPVDVDVICPLNYVSIGKYNILLFGMLIWVLIILFD